MNNTQIEMDRAMGQVERMGAKRMRDVAQLLDVVQEYARASPQSKADCVDVVTMLRKWAAWVEHGDNKNLDVTGKSMRDPDGQMEYLDG